MTSFNLQTLKEEIDRLSLAEKLDLIAYLAEKVPDNSFISAESKEIKRSYELEKLKQWTIPIDQANEIQKETSKKRRSGILKGTFVLPLPEDFDDPLEDFNDYME